MAAKTPLQWREYWYKTFRVSDDYLSSVLPQKPMYDMSQKNIRKMIKEIKKRYKEKQK
jgi:hypothetical protein